MKRSLAFALSPQSWRGLKATATTSVMTQRRGRCRRSSARRQHNAADSRNQLEPGTGGGVLHTRQIPFPIAGEVLNRAHQGTHTFPRCVPTSTQPKTTHAPPPPHHSKEPEAKALELSLWLQLKGCCTQALASSSP
ncbi:hypothetical protein SKAU_G00025490 [Synaphobranchus kaupii]|uniref:Uncharacterized protein n=1 Tax=Synaphobranchus kaupii TaxID=118154 RepID=A0A9Q1GDX5_SYNKA|nr:hypothetical protein SKAU_G00025490 [Synaphobranchus kaupii]